MSRARLLLACLAAAALCGCGYTGDPLPPALMIPQAVTDLRGYQQGADVLLEFTVPAKTTEDLLLKSPPEIELRAGPNPEGAFDLSRWEAGSTRLAAPVVRDGVARARIPAAAWAGAEIVFAVRCAGPKGRKSQWSNLLSLRIVQPPAAPAGLRAEGVPEGVLLRWSGEGARWRVYRRMGGEMALAAETAEPRWLDRDAQFDEEYEYGVEQVVETGTAPAVSPMSETARIRYEDRFPPAPPSGLRAVAGTASVELNWDRSTEPDLRGYQVWRGEGDGPLERLGEPVAEPVFSDGAAASGRRYRYAVSAIDGKGNESRPCEPVEIVAP